MGIKSVEQRLLSHPGYIVGKSYAFFQGASATNAAVGAANMLYVYPIFVPDSIVVTALVLRVQTGGAASAAKAAVWRSLNARPHGAPVLVNNTGGATTGSATNTELVVSGGLTPGWYWIGSKFTGTLPTCASIAAAQRIGLVGTAAITGNDTTSLSIASTYADDMPTFTGGESWTDVSAAGTPIVHVKL